MGAIDTVKTSCWEDFITEQGYKFSRIKAAHHIWEKPGVLRPVVHWGNEKEVPAFHVRSNLKTMGIKKRDFEKWLAENC